MADLRNRSITVAKPMPTREFPKEPLRNGDPFGHALFEQELDATLRSVNGERFFPPTYIPGTFEPEDATDAAAVALHANYMAMMLPYDDVVGVASMQATADALQARFVHFGNLIAAGNPPLTIPMHLQITAMESSTLAGLHQAIRSTHSMADKQLTYLGPILKWIRSTISPSLALHMERFSMPGPSGNPRQLNHIIRRTRDFLIKECRGNKHAYREMLLHKFTMVGNANCRNDIYIILDTYNILIKMLATHDAHNPDPSHMPLDCRTMALGMAFRIPEEGDMKPLWKLCADASVGTGTYAELALKLRDEIANKLENFTKSGGHGSASASAIASPSSLHGMMARTAMYGASSTDYCQPAYNHDSIPRYSEEAANERAMIIFQEWAQNGQHPDLLLSEADIQREHLAHLAATGPLNPRTPVGAPQPVYGGSQANNQPKPTWGLSANPIPGAPTRQLLCLGYPLCKYGPRCTFSHSVNRFNGKVDPFYVKLYEKYMAAGGANASDTDTQQLRDQLKSYDTRMGWFRQGL